MPVIPEYLNILINLTGSDSRTCHMSYYLSEALLHHTMFGDFSRAHLAATCLLLARILLRFGEPYSFSILSFLLLIISINLLLLLISLLLQILLSSKRIFNNTLNNI